MGGKGKRPRKPLRRNDDDWKKRRDEAEEAAASQNACCVLVGIDLSVSEIESGRTKAFHWQFRKCGVVVLHYWPTTGRVRGPNGFSSVAESPDAAFEIALTFV